MASVAYGQGFQALQNAVIGLAVGESAIVSFAAKVAARVKWDMGGVSWTIVPEVAGSDIDVAVEHSLVPTGDNWAPDPESPFTEATEGNEANRIERIRFTNDAGSAAVVITVAAPAEFDVETT